MHRYTFHPDRPGYVDAESKEAALKKALEEGTLKIQKHEIPRVIRLICSVSPVPDETGRYSAFARTDDSQSETVATADAPSPERALRALGLGNPNAHMHSAVYRPRFGRNYELITEEQVTKPAQQTPA